MITPKSFFTVLNVPAGSFDYMVINDGFKNEAITYAMKMMDFVHRVLNKASENSDSALQVVGICNLQGLSLRTVTSMEGKFSNQAIQKQSHPVKFTPTFLSCTHFDFCSGRNSNNGDQTF